MSDVLIEIYKAHTIAHRLNELEGIIRILAISDVIKYNMQEIIGEIKTLLKEAKIKEIKDGQAKDN